MNISKDAIRKKENFWDEFKKLDEEFGTGKIKICKKHGFVTSLTNWNYCPYDGSELCE